MCLNDEFHDLYSTALAAYSADHDAESAALCKQILATAPGHAGANHLLGIIELDAGNPEAAEPFIRFALIERNEATFHSDLALALKAQKRYPQAEESLRRALEVNPSLAVARRNLAHLLYETGRLDAAEIEYREALNSDPNSVHARVNLKRILIETGRKVEAIEQLRAVIELGHESADVYNDLGNLLEECGRIADAEHEYRRVIELQPDLGVGYSNLGGLLLNTGRLAEAEALLRHALKLDPDFTHALHNLILLLHVCRRFDEAERLARRAIHEGARTADMYNNLGNILLAKNSGDIEDGLWSYRRSIEADPDHIRAHSNLVYMLPFMCDDGYEILKECERFSRRFETAYLVHDVQYHNERSTNRRLRIGYVSPDFRYHCQSFFTMPLLGNHDHSAFEIYCYSSVREHDNVSHHLSVHADVWRNVADLDDSQLATIIMEDRIDILVDLTMHMSGGRPLLFARRPAPVQIAWLAYPGTTGSAAIGYRLTDPWLDPPSVPDADSRYTERSIRLPDTFWCYDPLDTEPVVNPLPADEAGTVTFGCLNNPAKLTDRAIALWANVIANVPDARMILWVAEGDARERVSAKFEANGVDRSRLQFVDMQAREDYLRTYHRIDVALDTFPCNGHTTSLDALWMGVPVVTRVGSTPISRGGYALLANLGLPELAAESDEAFVKIATQLALDQTRLRTLRSGLRQRMELSPLMGGARFARGVEAAFRQAWAEWCEAA
ncbi:tetratricopeptide repeat protein [Paraburkholderia hospita]|uniref:O-linked N-acetylglucosamine transferase family protein n=1 Tax=Paraburkholderia hospita TaxID=169430 RepID=UPI000DEFF0EC|nr:tetratricopeptide repeat protein [Paraburkholderia hospita]AXE98871.1 hypothetical protein CUJ88_10575 [Paraburkholderia hospita]